MKRMVLSSLIAAAAASGGHLFVHSVEAKPIHSSSRYNSSCRFSPPDVRGLLAQHGVAWFEHPSCNHFKPGSDVHVQVQGHVQECQGGGPPVEYQIQVQHFDLNGPPHHTEADFSIPVEATAEDGKVRVGFHVFAAKCSVNVTGINVSMTQQ